MEKKSTLSEIKLNTYINRPRGARDMGKLGHAACLIPRAIGLVA